MSEQHDTLVEQLRNPEWTDCNHHLIMEEAADAIDALRSPAATSLPDGVEITLADRARAWPFAPPALHQAPIGIEYWNDGRYDRQPLIQAFACHRIAAEQAHSTALAEVQAKLDAANGRAEALEGAIPPHLVAVMHRLFDDYAEPFHQIAVDASAESGLAITEKYVRSALKALTALGWATRSPLVCEEGKLRGSGYLLTSKGYAIRILLPEPRRIDTT